MKQIVYFEICGKKMKIEVIARDAERAKQIIRDKIIFHRIVPKELPEWELFKNIKNMFGIK